MRTIHNSCGTTPWKHSILLLSSAYHLLYVTEPIFLYVVKFREWSSLKSYIIFARKTKLCFISSLWPAPRLNLIKWSHLIYTHTRAHTLTFTHTRGFLEFWSEMSVNFKVRLKYTLSEWKTVAAFWGQVPPLSPPPPQTLVDPRRHTHMCPAQKSCLCSGKYSPGSCGPSSCQGDSMRRESGLQTQPASVRGRGSSDGFSLTSRKPLTQTCASAVKSAFLCLRKWQMVSVPVVFY